MAAQRGALATSGQRLQAQVNKDTEVLRQQGLGGVAECHDFGATAIHKHVTPPAGKPPSSACLPVQVRHARENSCV